MNAAEQTKANRRYYLARGRCPRCGGKSKVAEGRVLCVECQQKHDEEQTARREKWRAEGKCIRCGRDCADGKKQCSECLKKRSTNGMNAKSCAKWRQSKIDAGKCVRCGVRFAAPFHVFCERCLVIHRQESRKSNQNGVKAKERREKRIAAGLCIDCGKPNDSHSKLRCTACLEARRDSNRKYQIIKRIEQEAKRARARNGQT